MGSETRVGSVCALRDGAEVLVRPIEPEDKAALNSAFDHLSPQSRYQRFLTPMTRLSGSMLRYLTEVDHHEHEALVALDRGTGEMVAVARYVKTGEDRAEAAVTVADDWQGRGLGSLMLEALADHARSEGVRYFTALVLAHNDAMLALLRALGPVRRVDSQMGTVEIEAELQDRGVPAQLRELMRQTAAGESRLAAAVDGQGSAADGEAGPEDAGTGVIPERP